MPRVFTIPASAPFLSTLIGALRDGRLVDGLSSDPLALADTTLFLPTHRACALAREEFLKALKIGAAVLPRIIALGEIDEDELAFADMANGADALEIPEALGGLERRMLLAQLVLKWIASPSLPRRSFDSVRAFRRIQKIIHVTKPTAMIDSEPPSASWASNVRACWVSVRPSVTPMLTRTAIATPSQTRGSSERRFVRTRKATRMLTTSDASRPSRSPMRALPSMIDPVVR